MSKEKEVKKPPIGIYPKNIWESKRFSELKGAINRYLDASLPVSEDWIFEYNELAKRVKHHKE